MKRSLLLTMMFLLATAALSAGDSPRLHAPPPPFDPASVVANGLAEAGTYVTSTDNQNNAGTDVADGDMGGANPPYIFDSSPLHPIEFDVIVTGALPTTSAQLLVRTWDVDELAGELNLVYFNNTLLGALTGATDQWSTTAFSIAPAAVVAGRNRVRIEVDEDPPGTNAVWGTSIGSGQLVLDGGAGTATCRGVAPGQPSYVYGSGPISVQVEVDTSLASQNVRVELNVLTSGGINVAGSSQTATINGTSDDPFSFSFQPSTLPGAGSMTLQAFIFDQTSGAAQAICTAPVELTCATDSGALVNEVTVAYPAWVELFNPTAGALDMTGAILVFNEAARYVFPAGFTLQPGAYVEVRGNSGTNTATDLFANLNFGISRGSSAVALTSCGAGEDFVRWGTSGTNPPSGTAWSGVNPQLTSGLASLGRDAASTDTDQGVDWSSQIPTPGAQNDPSGPLCLHQVQGFVVGQGAVPVASPASSPGCAAGVYLPTEAIVVSGATPASGWSVAGWIGTQDDASTASSNSVLLDLSSSMTWIGVNYLPSSPPEGGILVVRAADDGDHARILDDLDGLFIPFAEFLAKDWSGGPPADRLAGWDAVVWTSYWAGPSTQSEAALATYLDGGGCLLVSAQDYHFYFGLTAFMEDYLGVASVADDTQQTSVSGTGTRYAGLGPFGLNFTGLASNWSDVVTPDGTATAAFTGDDGTAAIRKETASFRTTFLAFSLEAISTAAGRQATLRRFADDCGIPVFLFRDGFESGDMTAWDNF